ncbi:purine-cytosine permease family protein [Streptomyces virginiae]|uniref:purine-cytosine permease family protein n=1 Tax=Streptomyces TaxID=1883 RepID=UPI0007C57824|nr:MULTISPECIES: cytosine permease [Streptomyces]MCX4718194.1 cytosine permease [Streptomyces virginiae]MCX5276789.1 cytosine permease [Streptomyces virginiae]WSR18737.1 cytosine permease [Streptomyces sp. NBC_01207]WSX97035.1 cytosine permease [Streptomyces goshikiensis]
MQAAQDPSTAAASAIEARSIDHIPLGERHGKVWHVAPVWIAGNANVGTVAVGAAGVALGADLLWIIIAACAGSAFGAIFAALHSTQGPHLGLPQLIQSRPQFGYAGAGGVFVLALVNYIGFNTFACILAAQSLSVGIGLGKTASVLAVVTISAVIALLGYNWIHHATRWITPAFLISFAVLTVVAVGSDATVAAVAPIAHGFAWTPFLVVFGLAAGYQINWAIYVSDYTRYLPPTVSSRAMFWCTYLGMSLSSMWLATLGALLAARFVPGDAVAGVVAAGDAATAGFGRIVVLIGLLGLIATMAMNTYGSALTLISMLDTFRDIRPTARLRTVAVLAVSAVVILLTFLASDDFLSSFGTYLTLLLYLFAPWTAINLVDYFLVRRGRYSIAQIFKADGIYGRINGRGLLAYTLGAAAEVPFMNTSAFIGPVTDAIGGADLAVFVGLAVGGACYWLSYRGYDFAAEEAVLRSDNASGAPISATKSGRLI